LKLRWLRRMFTLREIFYNGRLRIGLAPLDVSARDAAKRIKILPLDPCDHGIAGLDYILHLNSGENRPNKKLIANPDNKKYIGSTSRATKESLVLSGDVRNRCNKNWRAMPIRHVVVDLTMRETYCLTLAFGRPRIIALAETARCQ
jgi:hypothetical protein